MTNQQFENLLNNLYNHFVPGKNINIKELVEKYNSPQMQESALQHFMIKYNIVSNNGFILEAHEDRNKFIKFLILEASEGREVVLAEKITREIEPIQQAPIDLEAIKKTIREVNEYTSNEDIRIDFDGIEIELPEIFKDPKFLMTISKGSRFMANSGTSFVAFEAVDVFINLTGEKIVREILLKKC